MPLTLVATITPTLFHVHLVGSVPPTVARAMGRWCMEHGINPELVPQTSPIVRDEAGCRIVYHEIREAPREVAHITGEIMASPVTMQGTTPPAPFPAEVLEWGARIK